jgi:hypothetical protein
MIKYYTRNQLGEFVGVYSMLAGLVITLSNDCLKNQSDWNVTIAPIPFFSQKISERCTKSVSTEQTSEPSDQRGTAEQALSPGLQSSDFKG